jgi:long-chain acyl-CoA synthetase
VLIVPEWETLADAMPEGWGKKTKEDRSNDPVAIKLIQREVTALTAELSDYERIRRVALLPEELTIDGGELTPTLKVKRNVIDDKFGELIDRLYGSTSGRTSDVTEGFRRADKKTDRF